MSDIFYVFDVTGGSSTFVAATLAPSADSGENLLEDRVVELYRTAFDGLFRYAMTIARDRELAADAIQESFLRYFVACKEGQTIRNDKAWLYQVLRNRLLDAMKAAGAASVGIEAALQRPDWRQDPEGRVRGEEVSESLRAALTPREMECLQLRMDGLCYREIALVLKIRPGTVGALLARALKKVQKVLKLREDEGC